MATVADLKTLLDLYGVGVRAGVFTPQVQDEEYFREIADLPEMSSENREDWKKSKNVRHPITLMAHDAHGEPTRANVQPEPEPETVNDE